MSLENGITVDYAMQNEGGGSSIHHNISNVYFESGGVALF